jgi:ParB family chromosome partitioning protein
LQLAIALRSVTEKQKAASGCFVYLNHDSTLSIDYGRTEPKAEAAGKSTAGKGDAATTTAKIPTKAALTQVLTQRLNEQRLTAIKNALISHPYRDEFTTLLGRIIASQIAPASRWNALPSEVDKHLDAIVAGIAPKVASAAFRKAFDAKDYFASAPKSFVIAAIAEAVNADEARKMDGQKRSEIAKFAMANVVKTGWLPKELRTVHYDGPQAKAKAKSAAKTKTAAKGK